MTAGLWVAPVITPALTGAPLLTNGDMESIVGWLDYSGWGVISQEAEARPLSPGTKCLQLANDAVHNGHAHQVLVPTVGDWIDMRAWARKVDARATLGVRRSDNTIQFLRAYVTSTDWTQYHLTGCITALGGPIWISVDNLDVGAGLTARFDDLAAYRLQPATMRGPLCSTGPTGTWYAFPVVALGTQAGLLVSADGDGNGVLAMIDRTPSSTIPNLCSIRLFKWVGGVPTADVVAPRTVIDYADGYELAISRTGDTYTVLYNSVPMLAAAIPDFPGQGDFQGWSAAAENSVGLMAYASADTGGMLIGTGTCGQARPRLFFSASEIPALREKANSTHATIFAPVQTYAASFLGSTPPALPAVLDLQGFRLAGNRLVAIALTYILTGDAQYAALARDHVLAYCRYPFWAGEGAMHTKDLGFHHILQGCAIAYDWIHATLSLTERAVIQEALARRAQESYALGLSSPPQWWDISWVQNHMYINHSALGLMALSLAGDDARADTWLAAAVDAMQQAMTLLDTTPDGSYHEGIPYQEYSLAMPLPFLLNLRRLRGVDLFPHNYLEQYSTWRAANVLPGTLRHFLSFGDFAWSWGNGYAIQSVLRFCAAEYRDGLAEWVAQQIIAADPRLPDTRAPYYALEFLYYDPTVAATAPTELDYIFENGECVIWRTGFGAGDLAFGLKGGVYGGRVPFDAFTGQTAPFTPDHTKEQFNIGHDHDDGGSVYISLGSVDLFSETVANGLRATTYHNALLVDDIGQWRSPDTGLIYRDPALFTGTDGRLTQAGNAGSFGLAVLDLTDRYWDAAVPPVKLLTSYTRHFLVYKAGGYAVLLDALDSGVARRYKWCGHFAVSAGVFGNWIQGVADGVNVLGVNVVTPAFLSETGNDGKEYIRIYPAVDVASTRICTVLYPTTLAGWGGEPACSLLGDDGNGLGVQVGTEDHVIRYGAGVVAVGTYSMDADAASIIKDGGGNVTRLFLGNGVSLADGVTTLISGTIVTAEVVYSGTDLALTCDDAAGVLSLSIHAPVTTALTVNGVARDFTRLGDYITPI